MTGSAHRGATGVAVVMTALGAATLLASAAWLVPWQPVPGGAPGPVPPEDVLTSAQIARAESFAGTARLLGWLSLAVSLAVVCALGFTRLGRRLVRRLPGPWWLRVSLAAAAVLLAGRVATLPPALALRRHLHDYGLSDQPLAGWVRDLGLGLTVDWVITSTVLVVLAGAARRWRRAWPLVAGLVLAGLTMAGSFGYPVLVEPLFNRFEPLPDGPLRTAVLRLAEQEGVAVDEVLVADASRRTTTLNAWVSGYGRSRRVVVYDNLVEDVPADQVLAVVAHELVHARHDDVLVGSSLGALGVFSGAGLLALVLGALGSRRRDLELTPAHPETVPLLLALVAVATLLAAPAQSTISRRIETRADVEALAATRDPGAFEAVQRQLAIRSLSDPTPPRWSHLWWGSHPTVLERVALARRR